MPFWKGDALGRPVELGRAIGARLRTLSKADDEKATASLRDAGLDEWAAGNLLAYLREQREATRNLPDDRTVVVERFRDEIGDWRLTVHCVLGARVNAPWALAIARRLGERYGVDGQVMPSDDGIVVRLPDTAEEPPGADLVVFDPEEISQLVEESVGTSALFASGSASAPPGRCCCPAAIRAAASRLAATAAVGAAARRGTRVRRLPGHAGGGPRVLQDVFDVPGLSG
jgi:ATP-dependent Lhr-like helicase